ncbi:MAG: long-chain-fatty-acid--CoA ligase, partial [Rhodocyclaceae bacterium]|nr:long-chain-fatty-acid--CoA ligase [Rhodocyclaceae bacterium]
MQGRMMQMPLLISSLLRHAVRWHGDTEIVSRLVEGGITRSTWTQLGERACQLAHALTERGVAQGERIGTLAWNNQRHVETYFAVSASGAVCHTVNPRLFPDQIVWIINDAEDTHVFFDLSFTRLVEQIAPRCPTVKAWIALTDSAHMPAMTPQPLCYETLIAGRPTEFEWPQLDENQASSLCYTSGTTGNPKGVLYSHRSTVLHAYGVCLPDTMGISASSCVLPVVPMFHVNAWGTPYAVAMTGAKLVLPGPALDGPSLAALMADEGVTLTAGVPTVWLGLLKHLKETGQKLPALKNVVIGGAAAPPAMIREFADMGITVRHAWGMTEMSPLGTVCTLKTKHASLDAAAREAVLLKQGRPLFGVDLKIVDAEGRELPHDGKAFGDLMVRGPWILSSYFKGAGGEVLNDGWFATGDVATISPDGYMGITDRSKDVIKSGGEWISSIDLENHAMAHPAVAEAAAIGVRHPKWDERPILVVVKKPGAELTRDQLLE